MGIGVFVHLQPDFRASACCHPVFPREPTNCKTMGGLGARAYPEYPPMVWPCNGSPWNNHAYLGDLRNFNGLKSLNGNH
jgi:hypothetical protein